MADDKPKSDLKEMTTEQFADNFYKGIQMNTPATAFQRQLFGEIKKAHPQGLTDRELTSLIFERSPQLKNMVKITDLTGQPPAPRREKGMSPLEAATTPFSELILGQGRSVSGITKKLTDGPLTPSGSINLKGTFAGKLVDNVAETIDAAQSPIGLITSAVGGITGKFFPKLFKGLKGVGMGWFGGKAVASDIPALVQNPTGENLADLVTDTAGFGMMRALKPGAPKSVAAEPAPAAAEAIAAPTPHGRFEELPRKLGAAPRAAAELPAPLTTKPITEFMNASGLPMEEIEGLAKMSPKDLRARRTILQQALDHETSPVADSPSGQRTPAEQARARTHGRERIQRQIKAVDLLIDDKMKAGGVSNKKDPIVTAEPGRKAPPEPRRVRGGDTSKPAEIPEGQQPAGLIPEGEAINYGPVTADIPGAVPRKIANDLGKRHGVPPGFIQEVSTLPNEELVKGVQQLMTLKAKLYAAPDDMFALPGVEAPTSPAAGRSAAAQQLQRKGQAPTVPNEGVQGAPISKQEFIDQMEKQINALTDLILSRANEGRKSPPATRGK